MFRPVRTTPPAAQPVSLEDAKAHLRVDFADDDALITGLIDAAVGFLDGWSGELGRCLIDQEWRQDSACWPCNRELRLPFPDVSDVVLTYQDADDVEQTVPAAQYEILEDARSSYLKFRQTFVAPSLYGDREAPISATFIAGYGATAAAVPGAIKSAILLIVGHLYENREDVVVGAPAASLPKSSEYLVAPFRVIRI